METLDQTKLRLETFIANTYPDADIAPGSVLNEWIVKLAAALQNEMHNEVTTLSFSNSVTDVLNSASDTYSDIIGELASNYNVERKQGKKVVGQIRVTVSQQKNYYVPQGFTFVQPNLNFTYKVTTGYNVVGTPVNDNDVALIPENDVYFFVVPVEASNVGEEKQDFISQLSHRTRFDIGEGYTFDEFVSAEAYGSFTSGQNVETDRELIARFKEGLATKGLLSKVSIESGLKTLLPDINVKSVSLIGSGAPEQIRGKANAMGVSTMGMVDVYARTCDALETVRKVVTATKSETIANQWEMNISPTIAPGFYQILSIGPVKVPGKQTYTGTYPIVSMNYGYQLNYPRNNYISSALEARFTRYQTCNVTFQWDPLSESYTDLTKDFEVLFLYMPYVADIQDVLIDDNNRIVCADYLVKAVVPCDVSIRLTLLRRYPTDVIPVVEIKKDIFTYVNSLGIGEPLYASKIIEICHNYNIKTVDLPIQMVGRLQIPGTGIDQAMEIIDSDKLKIPSDADKGVSPNNSMFFINYIEADGLHDNIGIEVI